MKEKKHYETDIDINIAVTCHSPESLTLNVFIKTTFLTHDLFSLNLVKCCPNCHNTLMIFLIFFTMLFAASGYMTGWERDGRVFLPNWMQTNVCFVLSCCALKRDLGGKNLFFLNVWQSSMACDMLHGLVTGEQEITKCQKVQYVIHLHSWIHSDHLNI